jgi:Holliday junction resolvase RusA-like endonuclease
MESEAGQPPRFEFVVPGTPVSSQTANRDRLRKWKESVRRAAREDWSGGPRHDPLYLKVTYFFTGFDGGIDNDNMVKPIQDALEGLVFKDDHLVHIVTVIRCNLEEEFSVPVMSRDLARALERQRDFVHIFIDRLPSLGDFP